MGRGADKSHVIVPTACPRCEQNTVSITPDEQYLRCYGTGCTFAVPMRTIARQGWIRYMANQHPDMDVVDGPVD